MSPTSTLHDAPVAANLEKGSDVPQQPTPAPATDNLELKGAKLAAVFATMMVFFLDGCPSLSKRLRV